MNPAWKIVLVRSVVSTAIYLGLFGGWQLWRGEPPSFEMLVVSGVFWFCASVLLERLIYPRFEI